MDNKQKKKYLDFLTKKLAEGATSNFFQSMHEKLTSGIELTERMVEVLDDIIRKDSVPKTVKTFKMTKWWMRKNGMYSMALKAKIEVDKDKAYLVDGHATIVPGTWCMNCGRELKQPASYTIGYGADCAKKIGIPYPTELNKMSLAEREEHRKKIQEVVENQLYKGWIPKSQVEEIIEEE